MKTSNSNHLGKTKNEIVLELGQEFNYYPSSIWSYFIKTNWLGQNKFLVLYFENEKVIKVEIKSNYGKFKSNQI